jgi:putative transposase
VKYGHIESLRHEHPIALMCRILGVSESGYHAWLHRPLSLRDQESERLSIEIKAAHIRTRETYGPERLQEDMKDNGIHVSVYRIKNLRKKMDLRCKQVKKFKATTNSNHTLPVAPNLLNQKFQVSALNQVWVTDLSYIPTAEGWLYLAGFKDLFSGELVGYSMGERMTQTLVMQALFQAVSRKRPPRGLIHHSDRGSQYCAHDYQAMLKQFGMIASMSRRGNCYDNAPIESFWGTLKNELVHHKKYLTREEAKQEITEYIEIFYNRQRKQARLGYLSPAAFIQQHYGKQLAA